MTVTAIDTDDELLAIVDATKPWSAGLPFDEHDPFDWYDKQQILKLFLFDVTIPSVPAPLGRSDDEVSLRRRPPAAAAILRTSRSDDNQALIRRPAEFPTQTGG
jgi:hypothetical protein